MTASAPQAVVHGGLQYAAAGIGHAAVVSIYTYTGERWPHLGKRFLPGTPIVLAMGLRANRFVGGLSSKTHT